MKIKTHRNSVLFSTKGEVDEPSKLYDALLSMIRVPTEGQTKIGNYELKKISENYYTAPLSKHINEQAFIHFFHRNGLEKQGYTLPAPGAPSTLQLNEMPKLGFE